MKAKKIFIVDDDQMLSEALSDYLTRKIKHQVTCFATGETCLAHLTDNPDVIILDYYLNTVEKDAADGMEILQEIREYDRDIRVIMLSSQERYAVAAHSLQKGAEHYVIKSTSAFEEIARLLES